MPKNHPKIFTKPPNSGECNEHRDLALLERWPSYWQKGRVKPRQNSLQVYPRLKAGVHVNRSRIWSIIKRELLGLNGLETLPDSWPPQVGRELFGIRLLILHFKFQFSKSIISYFPQFNVSFEKDD